MPCDHRLNGHKGKQAKDEKVAQTRQRECECECEYVLRMCI